MSMQHGDIFHFIFTESEHQQKVPKPLENERNIDCGSYYSKDQI